MRKVWLCIFYALCIFTIVFSLFWMALPKSAPIPCRLPGPRPTPASRAGPGRAGPCRQAERRTDFYLLRRAADGWSVYTCSRQRHCPDKLRSCATGIYVNLLPENDALRIKRGLVVNSPRELDLLLEDLGE